MELINNIRQRARAFLNALMHHEERVQLQPAKSDSGPRDHEEGPNRKGDPALLCDKEHVSFRTAQQYLGITERQRQKLVRKRKLDVIGDGQNRMITTESLRRYLPPKKSRTDTN